MCLVFIAWRQHPDYPLLIAANRDEYHGRPAAPADFWRERPDICAGRDLQAGGTWLGISRRGRFATITNFRSLAAPVPDARSRGELPSAFLAESCTGEAFASRLYEQHERYAGFSLLFGTVGGELWYFTNRAGGRSDPLAIRLGPGIHGLSNHQLDTPWPKLVGGKRDLARLLRGEFSDEDVIGLLADRSVPPDTELPDDGFGIERERVLAPRFIHYPEAGYGTRASTCVTATRNGWMRLTEQAWDAQGRPATRTTHRFRRQPQR